MVLRALHAAEPEGQHLLLRLWRDAARQWLWLQQAFQEGRHVESRPGAFGSSACPAGGSPKTPTTTKTKATARIREGRVCAQLLPPRAALG